MIKGHKIALEIAGKVHEHTTYHQAVVENEFGGTEWRGQIARILNALEFTAGDGHTREEWLNRAHRLFSVYLRPGGRTMAQMLRNEAKLDSILGGSEKANLSARTIHSVKGLEFPAICVVLTSSKAGGIITHLESEPDQTNAESAREFYVGASRAEKLLVVACPKSQSKRLSTHLATSGAKCKTIEI
ncbi:hypothetical protein NBRC116601_11740 [Cognatishimia sp. WU-CL00825]